MILPARLLYGVFKFLEKILKAYDQHFDVYFDKILYKKWSLLHRNNDVIAACLVWWYGVMHPRENLEK